MWAAPRRSVTNLIMSLKSPSETAVGRRSSLGRPGTMANRLISTGRGERRRGGSEKYSSASRRPPIRGVTRTVPTGWAGAAFSARSSRERWFSLPGRRALRFTPVRPRPHVPPACRDYAVAAMPRDGDRRAGGGRVPLPGGLVGGEARARQHVRTSSDAAGGDGGAPDQQ